MARLLLVRHGQSTWNADGRWQGQADPPLSETGRRQALEAVPAVGAVDAIFSSTLERAHDTAQIIAEGIGVGPVIALTDLVERNAGEWQGLTRTEIDDAYPGYLEEGRRPPGWEPDDSLRERAMRGIGRIVEAVGEGDALVVTHGGLIYEVERSLGAPFERMANLGSRWVTGNGSHELVLGERLDLLGGIDVTVPDQI
jgi:probable phosphoglycerate mutase